MDAQLFQEICDAIQNHTNRIKIPLDNPCPIGRVLWSTFDFMTGPVLNFAWEANSDGQPLADSGDETVDGNVSTDSSISKNTNGSESTMARNQFEEIDEILKNDLITAAMNDDDDIFAGIINHNGENNTLRPTTSTDTRSSFTLVNPCNSCSDTDDGGSDNPSCSKWHTPSTATVVTVDGIVNRLEIETQCHDASAIMTESCGVDSGIATTTSMESDLSAYCGIAEIGTAQDRPSTSASFYQQQQKSTSGSDVGKHSICYRAGSDDCNINLEFAQRLPNLKSSTSALTQNVNYCEEAIVEDGEEICRVREMLSRMARSEDESFTTSALLNTSSLADEELFDVSGSVVHRSSIDAIKDAFHQEAEVLTELNATGGSDRGMALLSDDEFVAKFVLAEQICSSPQPSASLLHKITTIPSRKLTVGSYIFALKHENESDAHMSAISVLVPLHLTNWYLKRQSVIEEFMIDTISRFKTAYVAEALEDALSRLTREFVGLLEMFAALARWPLAGSRLRMIKTTHLWNPNRTDHAEINFVAKAITACLMTKGMCIVVAADPSHLVRMMKTLCLFVDEKYLPFCLQPYRLAFSPYLHIQAVKRSDLTDVYTTGVDCHWPIAIVDVDRRSVTYSGSFVRHRLLKRRALMCQVGQILKDAGVQLDLRDENRCSKIIQIEPHVVRADASVLEFLELLTLLPLERSARLAHFDHFQLRIENRARALLRFVEDVSWPTPGDKRSAVTAPWNIGAARRALDLHSDAAFAITLARADEMITDFAEFFYQAACRQAKVADHQYSHRF